MIKLYVFVTSLTDELKSLNGENFLPPVPPKHLDFMVISIQNYICLKKMAKMKEIRISKQIKV